MKSTPSADLPGISTCLPLRRSLAALALLSTLWLGACSGSSGTTAGASGDADLLSIRVGRLVDVYGLTTVAGTKTIELFQRDVVIGPDIQDQRGGNSSKRDEEITYDFIGVDPETLQQKLLITRALGSEEFEEAFAALGVQAMEVAPGVFGQDTNTQPFDVVPRNGGFLLTFSKDLGLSEDFFVSRDPQGNIVGIRNPEAVQLLEILGDPNDGDPTGDFRLIHARIVYRGNQILLDPVLLGDEGRSINVPNTAKGLPESPNSTGANIRLALALEGPLRIVGLRPRGQNNNLVGTNLAGRQAIIRDFRSGNAKDNNIQVSNGFARDTTPPRVLGEMAMRLERVDVRAPLDQRVIVYKAGINHEIDRGDVLKLFTEDSEGKPIASTEVIVDPEDDFGRPEEQHVVVRVRDASLFLANDPSDPDSLFWGKTAAERAAKRLQIGPYPSGIGDREEWLEKYGPVIVLAAEYFGGTGLPSEKGNGDDPKNFLTFSPGPIPDPDEDTVEPNRNVSPAATVIVRFTKPVDLATVAPFDSLILATLEDTVDLLHPKTGTPHLIFSQVFDEDGSQTALRTAPPLGFYLDDEMRKASNKDKFPYFLHLVGGLDGIRDLAGNPLDFQFSNKSREFVSFPFYLDTNIEKSGRPRFANNRVITIARRFRDKDEDEDGGNVLDSFGAIVYQDGKVSARPTTRVSAFVDDRNQLPSPPNPPLSYCPAGQTATLTGATPFGQPIQNPLNPLGCRLQTVWREIDLSLSRTNPFDFNMDVEGYWWAPFQATQNAPKTEFDIFDRVTMYIGHSERRPSPCITIPGSLPAYSASGLYQQFYHNYLRSLKKTATSQLDRSQIDERPEEHVAFADEQLTIRNEDSVFEPSGVNRFLPMPKFKSPLFTWRDERVLILGGGRGEPRVLSPFHGNSKQGWDNARWSPIPADGEVGTIALPLLADFWVYPDDPDLPKDDPWRATGFNGWQISLTVQSSPLPNWRVYSGGGIVGRQEMKIDPSNESLAQGGYTPIGGRTRFGDNSCYWCCVDFVKRISVMTFGFINLEDPHNDAEHEYGDPRLGPYTWTGARPEFELNFEPPLSTLPVGTKLIAEFRGADAFRSNAESVPFEPLVAGDAHVRRYSNTTNDWLQYMHTNNLTKYRPDPNDLYDAEWLKQFTANGQPLKPEELKLINWRFIFHNNIDVDPPATAFLDSFAINIKLPNQ